MTQMRLGILPLAIETGTKYQLKTDFANYAKMKILSMKSTSAVVNILTPSSLLFFQQIS